MAPVRQELKSDGSQVLSVDRPLADDILKGVEGIALWWFGDGSKVSRKRISKHIERGLPVFRSGRSIYARKSVVLKWIAEQEQISARKTARN